VSKEVKRVQLGRDLKLEFNDLGADLAVGPEGDIETVSEAQNLAQAILARLSTSKGELADLGHPEYGSRLIDAVGQPNTQRVRNMIRRIVMDCLGEEERIEEVVGVTVRTNPNNMSRVDIEMVVRPAGGAPMSITLPFNLEVE